MRELRDQEVLDAIVSAWADAEYPGDDRLAARPSCCGEYADVAEFFRGRHWRDVTLETLREYAGPANACHAFMSDEALRFYLPSFMAIALDEPLSGARSGWEASMTDVALWALLPPRYRPEVHAVEQQVGVQGAPSVCSPEAAARLRAWWYARMTRFTGDQHAAIVAFLERLVERNRNPDAIEALKHWSASLARAHLRVLPPLPGSFA